LYDNSDADDRKALQRFVSSAESTNRCTPPALEHTYNTRCRRKAKKIIKDLSHTSHCPFSLLPLLRRMHYRSIMAKAVRLAKSFYP
jgi:hypothetical protein